MTFIERPDLETDYGTVRAHCRWRNRRLVCRNPRPEPQARSDQLTRLSHFPIVAGGVVSPQLLLTGPADAKRKPATAAHAWPRRPQIRDSGSKHRAHEPPDLVRLKGRLALGRWLLL
jgi:hypothetical protein